MRAFLRLKWMIISVLVLAAAVVIAVIVWWLLREEGPEAVSLEAAVEQTQEALEQQAQDQAQQTQQEAQEAEQQQAQQEVGNDDGSSGEAVSDDAVAGRWQVDASIGSFDLQQATGSFVGFRVDEVLQGLGDFTVVGRTGNVSGTVTLTEDALVAVSVEADLTALATDNPQRDRRMHQALDTAGFPIASFELSEPVALPAGAATGEPFSGQTAGDLTIKGITNQTAFDIQAKLVDNVIAVVGSSPVVFADYGIAAPTAPIVVSVEDHGIIEFQLLLTR